MCFTVSSQNLIGLKINARKPSKKVIFLTVNRQKSRLGLTVNCRKLESISNLTISADFYVIPAPEEFLNWKH